MESNLNYTQDTGSNYPVPDENTAVSVPETLSPEERAQRLEWFANEYIASKRSTTQLRLAELPQAFLESGLSAKDIQPLILEFFRQDHYYRFNYGLALAEIAGISACQFIRIYTAQILAQTTSMGGDIDKRVGQIHQRGYVGPTEWPTFIAEVTKMKEQKQISLEAIVEEVRGELTTATTITAGQ